MGRAGNRCERRQGFLISGAAATFDTPAASADRIQPAVLATMKAAFAQVENVASAIRERDEQSSASPREANPTPAPFVAGIPRLRVRPGTLWRDWQPLYVVRHDKIDNIY